MSDDLIYDGICPVCGDKFTNGYEATKDKEGESIEGVKVCVVDFPDISLLHFPE